MSKRTQSWVGATATVLLQIELDSVMRKAGVSVHITFSSLLYFPTYFYLATFISYIARVMTGKIICARECMWYLNPACITFIHLRNMHIDGVTHIKEWHIKKELPCYCVAENFILCYHSWFCFFSHYVFYPTICAGPGWNPDVAEIEKPVEMILISPPFLYTYWKWISVWRSEKSVYTRVSCFDFFWKIGGGGGKKVVGWCQKTVEEILSLRLESFIL